MAASSSPKFGMLLVISLIVCFLVGAIWAQRTQDTSPKPLPILSVEQYQQKSADNWQKKLDVSKASIQNGILVQDLPNNTSIFYTLDPELQNWARQYLQSYRIPYGAMIHFETVSGKIRVMAGYSDWKPQLDEQKICLTSWAPAASVFKLITAATLLEQGIPAEKLICYHGGSYGLNKEHIFDNPNQDKTCATFSDAIARSINSIMAKLAIRNLEQKQLERMSNLFGFNQPLAFELTVEPSKSTIPSEILSFGRTAAGFWHTEMSVLHGALIAGIIANGGKQTWARIIETVKMPNGETLTPRFPPARRIIQQENAEKLTSMMIKTTQIGTARTGFYSPRGQPMLSGIDVAGKTGSLSRNDPYLHYSWFVGFAPAQSPEVAFAVLLGNGALWRIKAHTAAQSLLKKYFALKQNSEKRQ